MAVGKAVVSTTVGAEGLDVHHGKDMMLADSPASFAESVIALLTDADLRRRQGNAATELASKYGWPVVARQFGEVLQRLVGKEIEVAPASGTRSTIALGERGRVS
jgi:polysaccharide biosynthesis protein PslH